MGGDLVGEARVGLLVLFVELGAVDGRGRGADDGGRRALKKRKMSGNDTQNDTNNHKLLHINDHKKIRHLKQAAYGSGGGCAVDGDGKVRLVALARGLGARLFTQAVSAQKATKLIAHLDRLFIVLRLRLILDRRGAACKACENWREKSARERERRAYQCHRGRSHAWKGARRGRLCARA